MKRMRHFFLGAIMSAALVIAGCSSNAANKTEEVVDISKLPKAGDFSKELTLNLSGSVTRGKVEDDNYVQKRLEEQFNIKIKNTKLDTWNAEQVNLMVASGDLPDTFAFTAGGQTAQEMYDSGLTRTIPKEMLEKYAPLYMKMLEENPPGPNLNLKQGTEDQYLQLIGQYAHVYGLPWGPTLRLDWLENLGIEPPGEIKQVGPSGGREKIFFTEEAYTLEELEEILIAFTFDDPDGNGKNDTYGISPANNNLNWAQSLMGAYGLGSGYNFLENGKLVKAEISEKYKEFLKQMAKWYDMGLVDPEFTTIDENTSWEKYKQGKIGYYIAQPSYLAMDDWAKGRAPQNIVENPDSTAKILATGPEIGPDGEQGVKAYLPVVDLADAFYVSKHVTDEELARILQIFDYINFDNDARWTLFGEVGVHSDWEGEPEKSALKVRPEYAEQEGNSGFWAYNFRTYDKERVQWINSEYTLKLKDEFYAREDIQEKMLIRPYKWDMLNETNLRDIENRYSGQMNTIVEEFRMKAIVGEVDIDKEWDKYVENYMNNGGKQTLEELEKAPKVSELLK
ncbi:type 2 periplasmic-binding domain-containing protein [Lederbergia lenta]|uniref:Multiple sugar transport system substrate-binding protein YtcQ n=1 Tax=Lederbergia lenta TaxID=1467 RepID=A0A2X4WGP8_LEDLE|nr:extracellular solute-binding protein [Lederbergia lenta]MEC2323319.1 extracellular solute-binding protein [Lederbergia lenta]SQI63206.1 multiple sugar transport system substrate-binding protein YtcQ [Lederbergia lenta]